MAEILEWSRPGDLYRDYCLWDYPPLTATEGMLRQSSLLWHSFEVLGAPARLAAMVRAIRDEIGPFQTVWGVKETGGIFSWELYFYDYARLERRVSIERILGAIAPFAPSSLTLSPARPYFMFSMDLDPALGRGERAIDAISVYLGNPSAGVSSGLCYQLTAQGLRFDNLYYFFDTGRDWEAIVGKVACSAHLDLAGLDLDAILWPEMRDCGIVVAANKKLDDGVYFGRIRVDQLAGFMERRGYPETIQAFLRENMPRLAHLMFDVGIDYRMRQGRVEIVKSAYYGIV